MWYRNANEESAYNINNATQPQQEQQELQQQKQSNSSNNSRKTNREGIYRNRVFDRRAHDIISINDNMRPVLLYCFVHKRAVWCVNDDGSMLNWAVYIDKWAVSVHVSRTCDVDLTPVTSLDPLQCLE